MPPLGLYLHVPFCAAICNYCNFNRGLLDEALERQYVEALVAEIRGLEGPRGRRCDTIYFGGGTPSLLDPTEIAAIISACRDVFDVDSSAEITMEANPETVDERRLAAYREAGVNRLSFGVQSFRDSELERLGRLHDAARARAAVSEARRAGFDNLSLDLMLWLPGQTLAHLDESLAALVEAAPEHASVYLLEIYPNAPLEDEMARSGWSRAPDDDAADMYLRAMTVLERAGYRQYRDLERGEARPRVAAQPEVLDRRRVGRVRMRCALDSRPRPVEQCVWDVELHRAHRAERVAGRGPARAVAPRAGRRGALHGVAPRRGRAARSHPRGVRR